MFDVIYDYLAEAAKGDFFAGGLALGLSGGALAYGRFLWGRISAFVRRRVFVSVTLDNRSGAYRHLMLWLDAKGALAHVRQIRVTDVSRRSGEVYAPAPGRHWFWRSGRFCTFSRAIREKTEVGSHYDKRPMEEVTLTVLFGTIALIRGWIEEGSAIAAKTDRTGPKLHLLRTDYWEALGEVTSRTLASVLADDDRIERLAADMRRFLGARDWYAERGIPWRRGYLLYGPPGTGKSSAIRALASELELDIATLDLGRVGLTDDGLCEAMSTAPSKAILAIEDIDAVFRKRKAGEATGVSFSGLLNAIDGVAAQEGRALIMTTNHRERLDPALIRPGRADMHVELGPVGAAAACRLFKRFFPGEDAYAQAFRLALGDAKITPAMLQGWLLENAEDAEAASTAAGLRPQPKLMAAE